jgi:hypothetical protein
MADEWREHGADISANHEIGDIIEIGRFAIDDRQSRAVSFGEQGESGCRPNDERRSDCEKKITVKGQLFGTPQRDLRHRLSE